MAVVLVSTIIFITAPIASMSTVNNVNAVDNTGPGYSCVHVAGSGTIGQVKCCTTTGEFYCTICDNTSPPSNCQPRELEMRPGSVFDPSKGGVLSQNDDSSDLKGIDPSEIQEGGTFNNNDGSNTPSNSENKIDSSKFTEGGSFNQ